MTRAFAKRKIKEAIKKLLIDGDTDAETRVSISRSIPTDAQNVPALLIYTTGEAVSRFNEAPKNYRRALNVNIEIMAAGNDDEHLDLILETIGDEVEQLMEKDETLGGLCNKLELVATAYQSEPDGQSPLGSLVLSYSVDFFTDAQQLADDCLEEFQGTDLDWKVGHNNAPSDSVIDAEDTVNVQTT